MKALQNKLVGFGTAALDFRISTAEMGSMYKEKLLAQETCVLGGGSVANCLVQIARLGGHACWLGKIGCDWIAERIVEQLQCEGVNCNGVIRDPALCSPFNVAVYAGANQRRVGGFLLPNSLEQLTSGDIEHLTAHIEADDWVLVEIGEIPLETILTFCRNAKRRHARIAIDVDLDPVRQCGGNIELITNIFRMGDLLIPNLSSVQSLYPHVAPDALSNQIARDFGITAIVTAGADGVYFCESSGPLFHQAAFAIEEIDSVGAGDAFHGGLLFALSKNWPLADAVRLGARCGALNCLAFGARTGMPTAASLGLDS